ncbi:MAG TPA: hypothetical protein VG323_00955, partial [Thermoanaerobaculia bacterium]|nr:hypothetical protein [Thermoanaerobaculia bacterium]
DVESPRWARDGSILFSHRQPDVFGVLHHDLFRWFPADGRVERVTHLADVEDADPLPDGVHAVAVRTRFGFSQLVRVDLPTGVVDEINAPSLDRVYSHTRRSAWAEHDADGWHIVRNGRRVADGHSPEITASGNLVYVFGDDIYRDGERITDMLGMAIDPAPAPDGSLYFMSLEPDGFVVRHLAEVKPLPAPPAPPPARPGTTFAEAALPAAHAYGLGRQELAPVLGGQYTAFERHGEVGVRMGDVVGRLDVLAIVGDGAALAAAYRGLPVEVSAHIARSSELRGTWRATFPLASLSLAGGTLRDRRFFEGAFSAHQRDVAAERISIAADSDQHARATVSARMKMLRASVTTARNAALGGVATSIEPESLFIARVLDPALPRDFDFAHTYRGARAEVVSGAVSLFAQRHHATRDLDLFGIEARLSRDPTPLVKAAGFDVTAGVARVRQERATRGWVALRWRP